MKPMRTTSYIGLVICLWDLGSRFHIEYEFLWSRSWADWSATHILYIFTRYSPFLFNGAHIAMLNFQEKYLSEIPVHFCRFWFIFVTVTGGWTMGLMLINLMLRVYALYNRDVRIIFILTVLLAAKFAKLLVYGLRVWSTWQFTSSCVPVNGHPEQNIIFPLIELVIQAVPVYLTFSRSARIGDVTQMARISILIRYLRRQGVLCLALVAACTVGYIVFICKTQNTPNVLPQVLYPLFTTLVSCLGCHLILQIRKPVDTRVVDCPNESLEQLSFELDAFHSVWGNSSPDPEHDDLGSHDPVVLTT